MPQETDSPDLLVAGVDPSFVDDIAATLAATPRTGSVEPLTATPAGIDPRQVASVFDGVVVTARLTPFSRVVERVVSGTSVPTVLLSAGTRSDRIETALEAGITDVFPRTATRAVCDRVVETVVSATQSDSAERPGRPPTGAVTGTDPPRSDGEYEQIFNSVNDSITVHDPETKELVDANETFCDLVGYDHEQVLELGTAGVSVTEDGYTPAKAAEIIDEVMEKGSIPPYEWKVETADGEHRVLEVTATAAEIGGQPRHISLMRDITERQQLEETYRAVFNKSAATITLHDPGDPAMKDVNETLCELLGYEREELIGTHPAQITPDVPGYGRERITSIHDRAAQGEEPVEVEWPLETRDGETRWIAATLQPVQIEGELQVLSTGREITEEKRREREYEEIFNSVPNPLTVNDPETGELLEVNDALCDILGYDKETILEKGNDGIGVTEEGYTSDRASEIVQRVMETGEPETFEWKLETADGEHRVLEVTGKPARIGGEERYVSLTRDITERKRREREYEQIFNGIPDPVALSDPETGELLEVNDALCDTLGYDKETILKKGVDGISVTEEGYTDEQSREIISRVMETGEPETYEWKLETAGGEHRVLEVTGKPATIGGEDRYISLTRDITEAKRREREFEQLFNGVNDGITIHDPETGEILDVNDTIVDMLGYDREQIMELGLGGISVEEEGYTAERGQEIVRRVTETEAPETVEWKLETANGDHRWVEATGNATTIGGEQRYLAIARDITERKRRDQAIRSLEAATDDILAAETPAAVADATVETAREILDAPEAVCWLDDTDGDCLSPAAVSVAEGDPERVASICEGDVEYGLVRNGEGTREMTSIDTPGVALETAVLLPLGDHGLLAVGGPAAYQLTEALVDVAEALADHATTALDRVERAREVRQSERRFRLIANRVDEIIYLATGDLSEVLYVNPAYEQIWGRPVEELYDDPTSFVDGIDPRDRDSYRQDHEALQADHESVEALTDREFEIRVRRPDGEVRWVVAHGYPVSLDDGRERYIGIIKDITERKRDEQRLKVFNRVLRHDLRNQLDVIKSHAEVLRERTDGTHTEQIIDSVDRLTRISNRARATDRIMSEEARLQQIDTVELVEDALDASGADEERVTIETDLPETAPMVTDPAALRAVVRGAIQDGVRSADSRIELTVEDAGSGYTIQVADDGAGIPPDELTAVREGAETDLRHVRGLGLWQLRWGVNKLNGDLSFDTADGTTVRITVPHRESPDTRVQQ